MNAENQDNNIPKSSDDLKNKMKKRGTKEEVFNGLAIQTGGGLMKADLILNKRGAIVSKKRSEQGAKQFKNIEKYVSNKKKGKKENQGDLSRQEKAGDLSEVSADEEPGEDIAEHILKSDAPEPAQLQIIEEPATLPSAADIEKSLKGAQFIQQPSAPEHNLDSTGKSRVEPKILKSEAVQEEKGPEKSESPTERPKAIRKPRKKIEKIKDANPLIDEIKQK